MACQLIPNLRGPSDGWCRATGRKTYGLQVPPVVPYKELEKFLKALFGTTRGTCRARFFRPFISSIRVDKAKTERTSMIFEYLKRAASISCSCTLLLCSFPQNLEQNTYVPFFHDNFFLKFFVGFFY